jgi:ribosomal protein S18 acetylase RimI-like enzyme
MHIRPATIEDVAGVARVQVDTWRASYRGIIPDDFLDNTLTYERREERWRHFLTQTERPVFLFVAEDDSGEIGGFASGGPPDPPYQDYDSELYAIYILPQHQGKGLGRALMETVAREHQQRGARAMLLWVFKDNASSRALYERMGGRLLYEKQFGLSGANIREVSYGWPDINTILKEEP